MILNKNTHILAVYIDKVLEKLETKDILQSIVNLLTSGYSFKHIITERRKFNVKARNNFLNYNVFELEIHTCKSHQSLTWIFDDIHLIWKKNHHQRGTTLLSVKQYYLSIVVFKIIEKNATYWERSYLRGNNFNWRFLTC